jgi:hypothetical protein
MPLRSLAYVRLDQNNGGIIRDLTQSGIALQAVTPLSAGDELSVRFDLFFPRVRVETHARVAWANANGQAGVCFTTLPLRIQRAIREWILTQMLTAAMVSGRNSIFEPLESQLVLSSAARSAILLPPLPQAPLGSISWGLLSLSVGAFAIVVDSLILLCAILLFSISSLAVMGSLPPLPLAAALVFAAGAIFVAAYNLLFSDFLCGASPGKRLALAASAGGGEEFAVTRFR